MNELFNKIHNPLFHVLCQATNEMCRGQKISRRQLQRLIRQIPAFQYNEAPEDDRELSIINKVFHFTDDSAPGTVCLREPVPPLITAVELSWLKSMLQDDCFAFLLADELRSKLLTLLDDVEPLFPAEIWQGRPQFDPALQPVLQELTEALKHGKMLRHNGELITPCKLEYDLATGNYALIAWRPEGKGIQRLPITAEAAPKNSSEDIPADSLTQISAYLSSHLREVSLRLKATRNCVERCFSLFSTYDKSARMEDEKHYLLTVSYYDFDEEDIVKRIKSLGCAAVVLSPPHIRHAMLEQLGLMARTYLGENL